jgi:hypothetical protein
MSETKLTAADYELRGLSPAQAAFAAGMRFAEPAPAIFPPVPFTTADYQFRGLSPAQAAFAAGMSVQEPPTDPQQQLAAMQQQLNAFYAKDDELDQKQKQSSRFNRSTPQLTTERRKLADTIKAHRAAMDAIRK